MSASHRQKVVVKVMGGLGNQLFQLAFGMAKASQLGAELWLDASHYNDCEDHTGFELLKIFPREHIFFDDQRARYRVRGTLRRVIQYVGERPFLPIRPLDFKERLVGYDPKAAASSARFFRGYWQSPLYWQRVESDVLDRVVSLLNQSARVAEADLEALSAPGAVALHIRLGDYVSNAQAAAVHGLALSDYYSRAIQKIQDASSEALTFHIFSDDPNPLERYPSLGMSEVRLYGGEQSSPYRDMLLMSRASRLVIANSTFSWWAAYLCKGQVYAPSRWLNSQQHLPPGLLSSRWEIVGV